MTRPNRQKLIFSIVMLFALGTNARACEPILPFMKVVGGPWLLTDSWIVLLAAVALKSIVFAVLQKRISFVRGLLLMFTGNVLTSFIGVIAAVMIGSGPIWVLGFLIVWALCVMPAKRLLATVKHPRLARFTPGSLAAVMALVLLISCFLFGISTIVIDSHHMILYWIWKLVAIYSALIVSIALTSFWEEWVIWKLSSCPADYSGYIQPVIRANLVVLLCVMLFAAAVMLPKRLKSPDFLASLIHTSLQVENR